MTRRRTRTRRTASLWLRNGLVVMLVLATSLLAGFAVQATRSQGDGVAASAAGGTHTSLSGVSPVGLADVRSYLDEKSALLVDARSSRAFRRGHLSGAVNWPAESMGAMPERIRRASGLMPVVVYCESPTCSYAETVARRLRDAGVPRVLIYHEGIEGWRQAGLDLDT